MNKKLKVYPELSPRHTFSLELKNVHRVISLFFFLFSHDPFKDTSDGGPNLYVQYGVYHSIGHV